MTSSLPQIFPGSVVERKPRRRFKRSSRTTTSSLSSQQIRASSSSSKLFVDPSILIAIALWYSLGILSISTTKVLLVNGTPPLILTVQQLLIGSTVLRGVIVLKRTNNNYDNEKNEEVDVSGQAIEDVEQGSASRIFAHPRSRVITQQSPLGLWREAPYLVAAGVCFTLGFLATNFGFQASSASFVETIKAAEPLTSAILAVCFKLETLNGAEWASIATLIVGVLCSTLGNSHSSSTASLVESLLSCVIVMTSNLCFSLRGLYQKWYLQKQASQKSRAEELQFHMQQLGVWLLLIPTIVCHGRWAIQQLIEQGLRIQPIGLALVNGLAFTSYNLSSTWLLNRITMVHHAALNCIRRIFAIVATSVIFRVPMTGLGVLGVVVSMCGFLSFSHAKATKSRQYRPKKAHKTSSQKPPPSWSGSSMGTDDEQTLGLTSSSARGSSDNTNDKNR